MKETKVREELANLSVAELHEKLEQLRHALFSLRLSRATAHVKDSSQFTKLRKNIARVQTYLRQKEMQ